MIVVRIDDPHPGMRDDDVVDVRSAVRYPAVVEYDCTVCCKFVELNAESALALGAASPRLGRLWVSRYRENEASDAWMPGRRVYLAPRTAALVLALGGSPAVGTAPESGVTAGSVHV